MKKWNTPEVAELNITETANGMEWYWEEGWSTNGNCYFFSSFGKDKEESGNQGGNQGGNPEQDGTGNLS